MSVFRIPDSGHYPRRIILALMTRVLGVNKEIIRKRMSGVWEEYSLN
jgi:hypothetical protein